MVKLYILDYSVKGFMGGYYVQAPEVYFESRGEEVLVTLPRTSRIISLSGSAICLWDALVERKTTAMLVKLLRTHYTVNEVQARKDITTFLDRCKRVGILVEG